MYALFFVMTAQAAEPEVVDLERYLDQRLVVSHRQVSTTTAPGYDGSGTMWFVEDGQGRLVSSVALASASRDTDALATLQRRRRNYTIGGVWAFAAAGAAATIDLVTWKPDNLSPDGQIAVTIAGGVALGTGFALLGKARASRHPSAIYTEDQARHQVSVHNARLQTP